MLLQRRGKARICCGRWGFALRAGHPCALICAFAISFRSDSGHWVRGCRNQRSQFPCWAALRTSGAHAQPLTHTTAQHVPMAMPSLERAQAWQPKGANPHAKHHAHAVGLLAATWRCVQPYKSPGGSMCPHEAWAARYNAMRHCRSNAWCLRLMPELRRSSLVFMSGPYTFVRYMRAHACVTC